MRVLAIDSATAACSVGLFDEGELIGGFHEEIGRGHAERLVPAIASLPGRGRAQAIRVSLGPGSFTGTRIGLAAARALGLAWGAQVRGYPTLALVAAIARMREAGPVSVAMAGGHGEWFTQDFGLDGLPESGLASLRPDEASTVLRHHHVAGSRANELVERRSSGMASDILPDARQALLLPEELLTISVSPIYGRPPDAVAKAPSR